MLDEQQRLTRARQLYVGYPERAYVPIEERPGAGMRETEARAPL